MHLTVSFSINGHVRESKLVSTPCIIGRGSQADMIIMHPMLSRKHCTLFEKDGELYVMDEDSLNGVWYKGEPISEPVRLQWGDEFSVGLDLLFLVSAAVPEETEVTDRVPRSDQEQLNLSTAKLGGIHRP